VISVAMPQGHQSGPSITLRDLGSDDLTGINGIIAAAIQTWDMAPRVKRLALASHQYTAIDFDHLGFVGAFEKDVPVGVVAAEPIDIPAATVTLKLLLIHGLYVLPDRHGMGIGSRLIEDTEHRARARQFEGLLVRAEKGAKSFFEARGFAPLPVEDELRDYPHRLLLPFTKSHEATEISQTAAH
jgi:predicted N-acetyltransferase YhbS